MSVDDELVREFVLESTERLDQFEIDLVSLEREPASPARIASLFRAIHTIKGTCSFLGFEKLESLTHAGENVLSLLRDGALPFGTEVASALLRLGDAVREILASVEARRNEGNADLSELKATLARLSASAAAAGAPPAWAAAPAADAPRPAGRGSRVRVEVEVVDELVKLVDELDAARAEIASPRLAGLAASLRECVNRLRLRPIGDAWSRVSRVVRDLALECGKNVRVETEGMETEVDCAVVEALRDTFVHLVRNAIDHGIETPAVRSAVGKSAEGRVGIRAFRIPGSVVVEVSDDGAGIDVARVRAKAIERGLVDRYRADDLTDREIVGLILLPGFSTAETVSRVSGRGVGLDVVKCDVEKLGGTLEVETHAGFGTTVLMTVPVTRSPSG